MSEYKILPLAKPVLRTWASESNLESIALLQENAMEWMFDNYINLMGSWHYQEKRSLLTFVPKHAPALHDAALSAWMKCPFLEFHFVSHNFVRNKYENILEYIMYAIEQGYYILFNVLQKNLSVRVGNRLHKTFVYGFDKNKKILYVADHYNHGKYALAELGFDEYLEAYEITYWNNNGNLLESGKEMIRENHLISIAKPKEFKYEFNLEWFKLQLKDYMNSTYSLYSTAVITEGEGYKRYFGISCYNLALDYLDELIKNDDESPKDWRVFTLICDHKKLLKMRMEFFQDRGVCNISNKEMEKYGMLLKSSEVELNLFLKYVISGDIKLLNKMQDMLMEMKEVEYKLLSELQNKL